MPQSFFPFLSSLLSQPLCAAEPFSQERFSVLRMQSNKKNQVPRSAYRFVCGSARVTQRACWVRSRLNPVGKPSSPESTPIIPQHVDFWLQFWFRFNTLNTLTSVYPELGCWLHIYRHVRVVFSSSSISHNTCELGFVHQRSIVVFYFCDRKTQQKQNGLNGLVLFEVVHPCVILLSVVPAVTAVSNPAVFKSQYIYIDHVTATFSSGWHLCAILSFE